MRFSKLFPGCLFLLCAGTVFGDLIWEGRVQMTRCEIIYGHSPVGDNRDIRTWPDLAKILDQIRVVYSFAPEKGTEAQTVVGISIFFGEQELIVPKELFTDYPNITLPACTGMRFGGFGLSFNANGKEDNRDGVPRELVMDVQNPETKPVFRIVRVEDINQSPIKKYSRLFPVVAKKKESN